VSPLAGYSRRAVATFIDWQHHNGFLVGTWWLMELECGHFMRRRVYTRYDKVWARRPQRAFCETCAGHASEPIFEKRLTKVDKV
jgi:hypothetical protein